MPRKRSCLECYANVISDTIIDDVRTKQVRLVKRHQGGIVVNLLESFNEEWREWSRKKLEQYYINREANDDRKFWTEVKFLLMN